MKNWIEKVARLKEDGEYRSLDTISAAQRPRTVIDNKEVIMLASNNYLGLSTNPKVKAKTKEVIDEYGTGSGGSRLTTGNYDLHQQLEANLAKFEARESALVFNTGYMANLGVISTLMDRNDLILSDELNHASIIDGCRLSKAEVKIYQHANLEDLKEKLVKYREEFAKVLIVTDGVFSMDGDLAPLPAIAELATQFDSLVMVDDAHGTGVIGEQGRGIVDYFGLEEEIDIQVGTLSKALASEGGFVAGSENLIELLLNKARPFIYSTALAPATIAASLAALDYLSNNPHRVQKLHKNIKFLKSGLVELGYQVVESNSAIIPIMIGKKEQALNLSAKLLEEGILAPAIRPPTVPVGTSRIRTTVMATHSQNDLEEVLTAFKKVKKSI